MGTRKKGERHSANSSPRRNFLGSGNDPFQCLACGADVLPLQQGGFRSHCPHCLWSRHVDEVPGDRAADCLGLMRPVGVEQTGGMWYVLQVCEKCGVRRRNRLALDDPRQPDSWDRVVALSVPTTD